MRPDVALVYVRDLIERLTGTRPEPDRDGDLPVHFHGAQFFVRVVGPVNPWIQVFSVAVADLPATPELMVKLNEINGIIHFARAFHLGTQVLIEVEIWAEDVTPENFLYACQNVAAATDFFGPAIQRAFGGRPLFEESKTEAYEQGELPLGAIADPQNRPDLGRTASPYL